MTRAATTLAVVAAFGAWPTIAAALPRHASPIVRWSHAPAAGTRLSARVGQPLRVTLRAASRDRRDRIHLSVLGPAPVELATKDGNPATAVVTFDPAPSRRGWVAVTFVARSARHGSITRTLVFGVRPRATLLSGARRTRWAYVLESVSARVAPRKRASVVTHLSTATPEQTPNLVVALAERTIGGRLWVKVRLSTLPNSRTGWVPRNALSTFRTVRTRLVIDAERMTATLYSRGVRIFRARVAVGRASAPTPRGTFYVREKLTDFHNPFYGPVAVGTSARSSVLTDWPGGGVIGIHGTNQPGLIPGRVSHGCIRLRNDDIVRLARLLPLGTPIVIV